MTEAEVQAVADMLAELTTCDGDELELRIATALGRIAEQRALVRPFEDPVSAVHAALDDVQAALTGLRS